MTHLLGIGCDLVRIDRIVRIAQRSPQVFLERILGDTERLRFTERSDWVCCACHIAAKEALFKAMGTGLTGAMRWTDVQVIYTLSQPRITASGAVRALLDEMGVSDILLTFGSDKIYALAKVLLLGDCRVADTIMQRMVDTRQGKI